MFGALAFSAPAFAQHAYPAYPPMPYSPTPVPTAQSLDPAEANVPEVGQAEVVADRAPMARMLADGRTCQVVTGLVTTSGEVRDEGGVLLYRRNGDTPFLRVPARADGLVVAQFEARANEVVQGRAYTGRAGEIGKPVRLTCAAGGSEPVQQLAQVGSYRS